MYIKTKDGWKAIQCKTTEDTDHVPRVRLGYLSRTEQGMWSEMAMSVVFK